MTAIPSHITFRGISHSPELDADIAERIEALAKLYPRITRCRVLLEVPHRHHRDGTHVHVRIEMVIPDHEPLVVSREPSLHGGLRDAEEQQRRKDAEIADSHRHAEVAIREAFETARRRLEEFARGRRAAAKARAVASRASGAR